ncbi:cyclodeaminase/cyclohydrolase family protein [Thermosediminibacter litoriperuensis]|uniref:Formimidoyltetrahydrofolate cyclodeaminase n=1 Tax=Thermosediminibacter litoriperuensis TaxID=291989 RepID=A0A5S5AV99_9FIRM|nr:cyclodeaminase/cyclohydrolase family protein [Thermosediminibacter litoriperuensis]TYP56648.1 Formimidoyltetrahydrofolate cyclodeaminase [Thermosediminibacter litoriperuensis]
MLIDKNIYEFVKLLASREPVPGGGGAAALVGAIGVALGSMVGNLTVGKEKYKEVEAEIIGILESAGSLQARLLDLVDEDARVFGKVAGVYKMPKDTEEEKKKRNEAMQQALKEACGVPLKIIELSYEAIKLHRRLADIGTRLAVSDVGVGVLCLKAALLSGRMNVLINLNGITDEEFVKNTTDYMERICSEALAIAGETYEKVENILKK